MAARLNAYLNANTSDFEAGLKNAARQVNNFSAKAQGSFRGLGGIISAVAGGAFVAFIAKQSQLIDETRKMAGSLNIGLESFQALARVAEEAGVEQEALTKAMTRTQQVIVEAAQGGKTYQALLKRLGLDTKELLTLSPDEQFIKFAEALSQVQSPTERVALAMEVFGKQGRALINLLPELAAKVDEARAFNDRFNISLNDIDAMKIEEANDAFGRVVAAMGGFGNTVALQVAPAITALSNALLNAGADGKEFTEVTRAGIGLVLGVVDTLRLSLAGLKIAFLATATGIQEAIYKFILAPIAQIDEAITNIAGRFGMVFGETPIQQFTENWKKGVDQGKVATQEAITALDEFNFSWNLFNEEQVNATQRARESNTEFNKMNETFNGLKETIDNTKPDKIKDVIEDLQFSTEQLTRNNEQQEIYNNLRRAGTEIDSEAGKNIAQLSSNFVHLQKQVQRSEAAADDMASAFGSFFDSAIDGSKSFGDSLVDLAKDLADVLFQISVVNPLKDAFTSAVSGGGEGGLLSDFFSSIFGSPSAPSHATGIKSVPRDMMARVHKGERITPANQVNDGMGGVNVIINNNNGSKVSQSSSRGDNGIDLKIMIDQAVAENIGRKGSRTNMAIGAMNGQSLTRR